ncbi:MAG: methyltransferase domain-containing protein [Pseudomonadota bacterium]
MDVVDLKDFYSRPLGQMARRLITHRIRARVHGHADLNVLGLGYSVPYLDPWRGDAQRVLGFMPAWQGVTHWPAGDVNASCLVDETELPLEDSSVDLAIIVHGLELTESRRAMLRELWRVMSPQGQCVFVVPNRGGMWARFDSTPFGHGRPFSRTQLTQLLRDAMFTPGGWAYALFAPPIERGFIMRSAAAWERLGLMSGLMMSGVIIVDAQKQVYAAVKERRPRQFVPGLAPSTASATASPARTPRAQP